MASKYKQQADGRWKTKVFDGTYKNGKKHYVWLVSSKSSRDLERLVSEFIQKRDCGLLVVSRDVSIQQYARDWAKAKKKLKADATKDMYDRVIEVYLKPFAHLTFEYFTEVQIQAIIDDHLEHPRTCEQIYMTLKQISKAAEKEHLLPVGETSRIFDDIQIPDYEAEEREPLSDEEFQRVHDVLVAHRLPPRSALFLSLIYFCGLRREEALALKLDDIHSFTVTINKALYLGENDTKIKPPKSKRGNRVVPLPPDAVPIITKALERIEPNAEGYLFTTKNGDLITKSSYRRMWDSIRKVLGFECTAHQLRHTYCTNLCYESFKHRTISQKEIARLLGDTEKMVSDVYSHIIAKREKTSQAITSIFSQKKAKKAPQGEQEKKAVNQLSTNRGKMKYKEV